MRTKLLLGFVSLSLAAIVAPGAVALDDCTFLSTDDNGDADSGTTLYEYTASFQNVRAGTGGSRVTWTPSYHPTSDNIDLDGNGYVQSCFHGGKIDGALPIPRQCVGGTDAGTACTQNSDCNSNNCPTDDAHTYYECVVGCSSGVGNCPSNEHCTGGYPECRDLNLGGNCRQYHGPAAIKDVEGSSLEGTYRITQSVIMDVGDGASTDNDAQSNIIIQDTYFADIHDDVAEADSHGTLILQNSLVERATMGLANDGADSDTCETLEYTGNMIELYRFAHSYKERAGHGGFWKLSSNSATGADSDNETCKYKMSGNYFLAGANLPTATEVMVNQNLVPPVNRTTQCAGDNWLLWAGTVDAWNRMAVDQSRPDAQHGVCDSSSCRTITGAPSPDAPDGEFGSNGERVAWFDNKSGCMSIYFRGDTDYDCQINGSDDGTGTGCLGSSCSATSDACIEDANEPVSDFLDRIGWQGDRSTWCSMHGNVCRPYQHLFD